MNGDSQNFIKQFLFDIDSSYADVAWKSPQLQADAVVGNLHFPLYCAILVSSLELG
jgi:hypothetical protein